MVVEGRVLALGRSEAGRAELVTALFDSEYLSLCRLASVVLGDPARVEDVVQEAFVKVFTGWGRLRDPANADAYLRRCVINLSRSRLRRRAVEDRGNAAVSGRAEVASHPGGAYDAGVDVLRAVHALPPRQRATVVLFYYADLPEAEVARTLGCSVGTVKSQLSKARATLAAALGNDLEEVR